MRILIPIALLFSAAAFPATSVLQEWTLNREGLRAGVVGCYALYDSVGGSLVGRFPGAPRAFRLDKTVVSAGGPGGGSRWLVQPTGQEEEFQISALQFDIPVWSADSLTDSVRFAFSNGFSGSRIVLSVPADRDSLSGRLNIISDVLVPGKPVDYRVTAARRNCFAVLSRRRL